MQMACFQNEDNFSGFIRTPSNSSTPGSAGCIPSKISIAISQEGLNEKYLHNDVRITGPVTERSAPFIPAERENEHANTTGKLRTTFRPKGKTRVAQTHSRSAGSSIAYAVVVCAGTWILGRRWTSIYIVPTRICLWDVFSSSARDIRRLGTKLQVVPGDR